MQSGVGRTPQRSAVNRRGQQRPDLERARRRGIDRSAMAAQQGHWQFGSDRETSGGHIGTAASRHGRKQRLEFSQTNIVRAAAAAILYRQNNEVAGTVALHDT